MADCKDYSLTKYRNFVVLELQSVANQRSLTSKAINSFLDAVGEQNLNVLTLGEALTKWSQLMQHRDRLSGQTRLQYLRRMHTLYKSAVKQKEIETYEDCFNPIIENTPDEKSESGRQKQPSASKLCAKIASVRGSSDNDKQLADIIMLAVYDRGITLSQAINRQRTDSEIPQVSDIIDNYHQANRQTYVFPLSQWKFRDEVISGDILQGINKFITSNYSYECPVVQLPSEAWVEAAIKCGLSDAEIKAMVGQVPDNYSYLKDVEPAVLSKERIKELTLCVANQFSDRTERWHIIRLARTPGGLRQSKTAKGKKQKPSRRKIVTPTMVSAENIISLLKADKIKVETLYPYQDLVRRVGKRMEQISRPFISDLMFIRLSESQISVVSQAIENYGRFVKSREAGSYRHAIVPDVQMENFQTAIGYFNGENPVEISEVKVPTEGDMIGIMAIDPEKSFEVEKIVNYKTGKSSITLQLAKVEKLADGKVERSVITVKTTLDKIIQ